MSKHWKSMMDRDYIYAFDLEGRDVTVRIDRVEQGELTASGGRKAKKPVVFFAGASSGKGLALNATNCKTIANLYGNYVDKWIGKLITLYPTTTTMGSEAVECIRIRPSIPRPAKAVAPKIDIVEVVAELSSTESMPVVVVAEPEVQS